MEKVQCGTSIVSLGSYLDLLRDFPWKWYLADISSKMEITIIYQAKMKT